MKCPSNLNNAPLGGGIVHNKENTATAAGMLPCELEHYHEVDHQLLYIDNLYTWPLSYAERLEIRLHLIYEAWSAAGAWGTLDMRVPNPAGDEFLRLVRTVNEVMR